MSRHATIRTEVTAPDVVAGALRPDNTAQMRTRVESGTEEFGSDESGTDESEADESGTTESGIVATDIERDSTGGLRTTVDDYVVNLTVATEVVKTIDRLTDDTSDTTDDTHT